jgi:hypothetical protein
MTQDGVAVWLGIDWADEKHRRAMRIDGESRMAQHVREATSARSEHSNRFKTNHPKSFTQKS